MTHRNEIDQWCDDLVNICLEAGQCLPSKKSAKTKAKCIPGWNELVKPQRQDSLFWFNLWKQAGKPKQGVLYENVKESKRQYFYAIRRCKRKERFTRYEKMAEAIYENKSRNFFEEVKRINTSKACKTASINNESDPHKIASIFAEKYATLFNSVPSDSQRLIDIDEILSKKLDEVNYSEATVTGDMVAKAAAKLKKGKSDGIEGLISNHVIYATDLFYYKFAQVATAVLVHGHHPRNVLISAICSIPKDSRGSLCCDQNYRGIALSSSLGKILDLLMLTRNNDELITSDRQFAFKSHLGTTMCSLVVKETIQYYLNNGSGVASCFLDATKAFDKVRYDKLFDLLIERKMNAIDLRALKDLYARQIACTMWDGVYSRQFKSTNGIRQGGIASPILFTIYMDELLSRLQRKGFGCWIGTHYLGAICYADDLTLLSPSIYGLQAMINECQLFAEQFGMEYNPKKSGCVYFSKRKWSEYHFRILLNGLAVPWVKEIKHLGNILSHDLREKVKISLKRGDLVGREYSFGKHR